MPTTLQRPQAPAARMEILVISGGLRRGSFNTGLARAASELGPAGMECELFTRVREVPPYDQDQDNDEPPEPVRDLRAAVAAAGGLLIVTPELNHSVPGQLKNLIDWLAHPLGGSLLHRKPVAIAGASTTRFGTVRAQMHLRQILACTDSLIVAKPDVCICAAGESFDEDGRLIDRGTRELVRDLMTGLAELVTASAGEI